MAGKIFFSDIELQQLPGMETPPDGFASVGMLSTGLHVKNSLGELYRLLTGADIGLTVALIHSHPYLSDSDGRISQWSTAYGWGNHASAGYLTGITKAMIEAQLTGLITSHTHNYLSSYTETDPVWMAEKSSYYTKTEADAKYALIHSHPYLSDSDGRISQWSTAYGWGNHASAGYLTGITKAMIEAQLTGAITSHTHGELIGVTVANLNISDSGQYNKIRYDRFNVDSLNIPVSINNANGVLTMYSHAGDYGKQIAFADSEDLYIRRMYNGSYASWYKLFHDGNFAPSDYSLTSHTHSYLALSGGIMDNTNTVTNLNADLLDGYHLSDLLHKQSMRDFTIGTLIQTSIPYGATGDAFLLEITGNSYHYAYAPFDLKVQGYIYSSTIINTTAISNGYPVTELAAFSYNGYLSFWMPRMSYWQGFNVKVSAVTYAGTNKNYTTTVTDESKPVSRIQEVAIPIQQSWHTGNLTPTLTAGYLPYWNGTTLANSHFYNGSSGAEITSSYLYVRDIIKSTTGTLILSSGGGYSGVFINYNYGGGSDGLRVYDGGTTNFGRMYISDGLQIDNNLGKIKLNGQIFSPNNYFSLSPNPDNDFYGSPWYGLSRGIQDSMVNVAGYYGVRLKNAWHNAELGQNGLVNTGYYKTVSNVSMVGDYVENGTTQKIIWTIGSNWTSLSNHYGLGYIYDDIAGFYHSYFIAECGTRTIQFSGSTGKAKFSGSINAPSLFSSNVLNLGVTNDLDAITIASDGTVSINNYFKITGNGALAGDFWQCYGSDGAGRWATVFNPTTKQLPYYDGSKFADTHLKQETAGLYFTTLPSKDNNSVKLVAIDSNNKIVYVDTSLFATAPTISVDPTSGYWWGEMYGSGSAVGITITITAGYTWEVSSKPAWMTVIENHTNNTLSIYPTSFYEGTREGDIIVRSVAFTGITATISVTQEGYPE